MSMSKRTETPPAFETVYRRARRDHESRDLYFAFCERVAAIWGFDFGREQRGHAVWVWQRNERSPQPETVKALCGFEFRRYEVLHPSLTDLSRRRKKRSGGPKPKPENARRSKTLGMVSVSPDELAEIRDSHDIDAWSADAVASFAGLNFSEWARRKLTKPRGGA